MELWDLLALITVFTALIIILDVGLWMLKGDWRPADTASNRLS